MGTSKPGPHPRVSDEEILATLREADSPVLSTADVAESLPIARRTTLNRLKQLRERGLVDSHAVGGRNTVWWAENISPADDRTAVEERPAGEILDDLDAFIEAGDAPAPPLPSVEAVSEDYHARRHRENLERLAREGQ